MKMGENVGEPINESLDTSKKGRVRKKQLYNSILQLMEFYFSDANLSKDRFLMQLLQNDPYVEVDIFLKFNKIRKLNCSAEDIKKAIGKSELLELSEDREKVKRKTEVHQKENVDSCTIYVENIKADATHESLSQIFSEFGKVVYVSIPKYKHNKANKGFAFIEFESESDTQNTLEYFASIGCRMPADTEPDKLVSIQTFEESENMDTTQNVTQQSKDGIEPKKRKIDEEDETNVKKMKTEGDCVKGKLEGGEEKVEVEEDKKDGKKKKKHKKDKKKNHIKELGLQILSKIEWKKMRNRYLNLQRKKMKELKQYLHKQSYNDRKKNSKEEHATKKISKDLEEFVPGIIVKMILPEPCLDAKKIKSEMRATSPNIKFVDVPNAVENNEVYLRFSDSECAKKYVSEQNNEDRQFVILEGDEEKRYWHKLKEDRERFEEKKSGQRRRKQRGRDKLIKRAEKEAAKHIFFEGKEGEDVSTAIPSM
ncbi:unnamed protein product [Callosobruchus maculatus]|uniref:Uncharacterized protein n=1 Tax=Callosobruchus maculatus TaxID=64391 RepID=A0A653D7C6_CALMS|nr:unnamed protein product [Callosobruchus maculatus]